MKPLSVVMALLFLVAAAVQWNDPDSLPWIAVYAAAAAISTMRAFGRCPSPARVGAVGVALIAGAWLGWIVTRDGAFSRSEVQREVGGLALVTGWMLVVALVGSRKRAV